MLLATDDPCLHSVAFRAFPWPLPDFPLNGPAAMIFATESHGRNTEA